MHNYHSEYGMQNAQWLGPNVFTELAPRPIQSTIRNVRLSVCLSVCLCRRKIPTSRGQINFWSKVLAHILISDDTIFQKNLF